MADLQAEVQAAADEMVAAGTETGLQVAVHRHGLVVADVVSGVEDARTATPVTPAPCSTRRPRPRASPPRSRTSWPNAAISPTTYGWPTSGRSSPPAARSPPRCGT